MSLVDYIQVRHAVYLPHTAGRYAKKQFKKAQMPIVERLVDSLMMKGRNNGKKLLALRIVAHAFEIINLLSDQNPVQVSARISIDTLQLSNRYLICIRFSSMLSSTLAHVRTARVLARRVPSVARPSMSPRSAASTRPSPS